MTDRLDEIRKRHAAAYSHNEQMPALPSAMADIAYLLKEVDNLTHDIGEALNTITLEVEARVKAEAEVERLKADNDFLVKLLSEADYIKFERREAPQEPRP
jgi:hypothetical protein